MSDTDPEFFTLKGHSFKSVQKCVSDHLMALALTREDSDLVAAKHIEMLVKQKGKRAAAYALISYDRFRRINGAIEPLLEAVDLFKDAVAKSAKARNAAKYEANRRLVQETIHKMEYGMSWVSMANVHKSLPIKKRKKDWNALPTRTRDISADVLLNIGRFMVYWTGVLRQEQFQDYGTCGMVAATYVVDAMEELMKGLKDSPK